MSFSQEIQFFKLFLYCEKTLTYWHPSSATSFSEHTGQDAENSCITGNNLSTLQILNKCATVKMIYRPSSFPLGQAVATMDVTEKLEMLPSLPSHSGIFLLRSFVHLTELCLKCVFTPSLHDKPTQVRRQAYKNHRSPAGSSTVGVILDTALHSSCTFSGFQVDSVPLAYCSSSWETRRVHPNENTSSTSI